MVEWLELITKSCHLYTGSLPTFLIKDFPLVMVSYSCNNFPHSVTVIPSYKLTLLSLTIKKKKSFLDSTFPLQLRYHFTFFLPLYKKTPLKIVSFTHFLQFFSSISFWAHSPIWFCLHTSVKPLVRVTSKLQIVKSNGQFWVLILLNS